MNLRFDYFTRTTVYCV